MFNTPQMKLALILSTLTVFPFLISAQDPPQGKASIQVRPGTVYLDKVGSETTLTKTVSVLQVGPPGAALSFTASVATSSGGNWLTANPLSGPVPSDLTITGTPGTLGPGVYSGSVTVTPSAQGASAVVVNVILRILSSPAGPPAVMVRPGALNFVMVQGGANPANQTLNISSPAGGASFNWTATKTVTTPPGGTWFQIAPASGSGPGSITVSINSAGLAQGRYTGSISVTSGSTTAQAQVSLEVRPAAEARLVIDPRAFNFIVLPGGPPPAPKTLRVNNTGAGSLNWTAAATSSGWLSITPTNGSTPATIKLTVNPAGLAVGMYDGSVNVTAAGKTETARVFLRVLGPAAGSGTNTPNESAVQFSPRAIEFSAPVGGSVTPSSVALQLTSKTTGLTFSATRTTALGGNWFNISPANGSIPGTVNVTASAAGLSAGVYTGVINIKVQGSVSEQRIVPVTLRVGTQGETPRLSVHPGAVVFQAVVGGANPAPAQVTLDSHGAAAIPFSATVSTATGGNWLSITPSSGTAPTTLAVSAANLASLSPGVYPGAVVFQATGSPGALAATLKVMLVVRAASPPEGDVPSGPEAATGAVTGVFLNPSADFVAVANSPQAVSMMLFASDGTPVEGADVQISSSSGEPTFALEDAGGGLYTGLFQSLTGGPVALTAVVSADVAPLSFSIGGDVNDFTSPPPVIFQGGVVSSASFSPAPTPTTPGAILSLFGRGLVDSTLSAPGFPLPRELAGVKVLVAGVEAPLIHVVANAGDGFDQIDFQAPVELSALSFADVVVLKNGVFSAPEGIAVATAVPAFFTWSSQGSGPAAALHSDFTFLNANSPARPGETIIIYATALGAVQPSALSGEAAGGNSRVTGSVEISIGGRVANADFVGLAPGYAGVYQINVTVPDGTPPGDAALTIKIDGISSGDGVVISIGAGPGS